MFEIVLFLGCIVIPIAIAAVVIRTGTVFFGLSLLNIFMIASAALPVFFFGKLLGAMPDTFTSDHLYVVAYTEAGLLAMVLGMFLAWRPFAQRRELLGTAADPLAAPHLTHQLGLSTFYVGIVADLLESAFSGMPTISTAVHALAALARLGLFILLIDAFRSRRWSTFLMALAVFYGASVVASFASGHNFLRIDTLIPLLAIAMSFLGFTVRTVGISVATMPVLPMLVGAWLQTRIVIRSGSLSTLPLGEQISRFFGEFVTNLGIPDASVFMGLLQLRVDMTDLLAAQVRYQPLSEPYAWGETFVTSFYTLIPRALWPEKPVVAGGSQFVERFTGIVRPADDVTSIGLPYPFELYANGGPLLAVIGLGVIAYICARMEMKLFQRPSSIGYFWALGLSTIVLCEGGQRTDVVLPALVASALTAYALGWTFERFGWTALPPTRELQQLRARRNAGRI